MPRKQIKPPIRLRKKFQSLIDKCRELVLTAPPRTSGSETDKLITICIKWPMVAKGKPWQLRYTADLPKGFPVGTYVEKNGQWCVMRHNVELLLGWFKDNHYCNFNASDLFAMRLPVLMRLAKLELKLDRMLEGINVDVEQQADKIFNDDLDDLS